MPVWSWLRCIQWWWRDQWWYTKWTHHVRYKFLMPWKKLVWLRCFFKFHVKGILVLEFLDNSSRYFLSSTVCNADLIGGHGGWQTIWDKNILPVFSAILHHVRTGDSTSSHQLAVQIKNVWFSQEHSRSSLVHYEGHLSKIELNFSFSYPFEILSSAVYQTIAIPDNINFFVPSKYFILNVQDCFLPIVVLQKAKKFI